MCKRVNIFIPCLSYVKVHRYASRDCYIRQAPEGLWAPGIPFGLEQWGVTDIPPQASVAVYERGSSGLLSAARIYDDVEPPTVSDASSDKA